jgi:disulfide bond formation protein DsbB
MRNPLSIPADAAPLAQESSTRPLLWFAALMLLIASATILGALAFEYIGGYLPCPLCLMQRTPYYIGVPVAAAVLMAVWVGAPRSILVLLFVAFAVLMIYGGGLAVYHSGVEWRFWEGPAVCAPSTGVSGLEDMLNQLETTTAPSCSEAVWRFLGLSFAGWNAIVSLLLVVFGVLGVRAAWRDDPSYGSSSASQ